MGWLSLAGYNRWVTLPVHTCWPGGIRCWAIAVRRRYRQSIHTSTAVQGPAVRVSHTGRHTHVVLTVAMPLAGSPGHKATQPLHRRWTATGMSVTDTATERR